MTVNSTTAAIASAEGSHGPLNNTNTTSQSSANGSSMSTDHSLLVGVSQTPVQSSGGLSSNSTPPPSHSNSTQQLHAASATSTGGTIAAEAGAEVTASSELEHVDNGEEVELEVTAELVERTQSEYFDRSPFVLEVTASATSTGQSVNTQYQLDENLDYYVCPQGHGKHGTDNCGQQYRT